MTTIALHRIYSVNSKKCTLSWILFLPILSPCLWGPKISVMVCRSHFLQLGSTAHNYQDLSQDTYDLDEPVASKAPPLLPQAPVPFQTASLTVGNGPCALGVPGWNKTTKQNKTKMLFSIIKMNTPKSALRRLYRVAGDPEILSLFHIQRTKCRRPHGSMDTSPMTVMFMIVQSGKAQNVLELTNA